MDPKVIGQGTYGCVLKPSLECKDKPGISYTNKVSKLLTISNAKKEIAEYSKVSNADKKNQFYLGKPDDCRANDSQSNINAIRKCHIGADAIRQLSQYQLILMEDGGENIVDYTDKMRSWPKSEMSTENCEKFALEALRLFTGLKLFLDKNLVHHDLKPQNIVYNAATNRLNFIDFGMMQSKRTIMTKARKNACRSAFFHWSYPWELRYINSGIFNVTASHKSMMETAIATLKNKNGPYSTNLGYFFGHVLPKNMPDAEYQEKCNEYISGYEVTLHRDMNAMGYDAFLEKSVSTIDLFGVGMAMNYWIAVAKKHLEPALVTDLEYIFRFMISPLISSRYTVDELISEYEAVLMKHGLLVKYDKEIVDHIVVNGTSAHKHRAEKPAVVKRIKKFDTEIVNAEAKPCPEGKEINPLTGRCIKSKPVKDLTAPCPPGKERNLKTGRCIKIKPANVIKNTIFAANCPAGKERNPKTRRCVNVCKDGYERDANFRCTRKKR
jgi:serine/threonine protein kinase